jgi:hypothetical protein
MQVKTGDPTRIETPCDRSHVLDATPRGVFVLVLAGGLTVTNSGGFRASARDYLTSLRIAPT